MTRKNTKSIKKEIKAMIKVVDLAVFIDIYLKFIYIYLK